MIITHHKQLHTHTHPTTPYPHPHVFLLSVWVSFIPSSPPDAYHCGRSIKCNVCRREIIGNMWWELKTLSHFKLPIICSKGECIVLQSAWKKRMGGDCRRKWSRREAEVSQLHLAEMFIRQNNHCSLLAFVFLVMLWSRLSSTFAKNAACGVTSLNSVIICHGKGQKTIDNLRKNRQGITGMWTQD